MLVDSTPQVHTRLIWPGCTEHVVWMVLRLVDMIAWTTRLVLGVLPHRRRRWV
jgi:hypothetical protein